MLPSSMCLTAPAPAAADADAPTVHTGLCDASAVVALDANTFLVAEDEMNVINVYRTDRPGPPLKSLPWSRHLAVAADDEHPEVDIEGAALLGGRVYWIGSHGRNKDGKWRPNRHRLFATDVAINDEEVTVKPFGRPYEKLATALAADSRLRALGLHKALGRPGKSDKDLVPTKEGLNIEGLSAMADGGGLLIGFRNPLPGGRALLVPLKNPAAVVSRGAAPVFCGPIRLRLRGRRDGRTIPFGIRGIEYSPRHEAYLIVAGPGGKGKLFAIYKWSGHSDEEPVLQRDASAAVARLRRFTAESLVVYPHTGRVQIFSDDGTLKVKVASPAECAEGAYDNGVCQAKHLLDNRKKTFRGVFVTLDAPNGKP